MSQSLLEVVVRFQPKPFVQNPHCTKSGVRRSPAEHRVVGAVGRWPNYETDTRIHIPRVGLNPGDASQSSNSGPFRDPLSLFCETLQGDRRNENTAHPEKHGATVAIVAVLRVWRSRNHVGPDTRRRWGWWWRLHR